MAPERGGSRQPIPADESKRIAKPVLAEKMARASDSVRTREAIALGYLKIANDPSSQDARSYLFKIKLNNLIEQYGEVNVLGVLSSATSPASAKLNFPDDFKATHELAEFKAKQLNIHADHIEKSVKMIHDYPELEMAGWDVQLLTEEQDALWLSRDASDFAKQQHQACKEKMAGRDASIGEYIQGINELESDQGTILSPVYQSLFLGIDERVVDINKDRKLKEAEKKEAIGNIFLTVANELSEIADEYQTHFDLLSRGIIPRVEGELNSSF